MKKKICMVLCMILILLSNGCLAALTDSLPEKMKKQVSFGSGLKGEFTIHSEGEDPLVHILQPFQDVALQFRGLRSSDEAHYCIYQNGEKENQKGLTELYESGKQMYIRSDLLPDEVFRLPGTEALADALFKPEGGNPSLASVFLRWMNLDKDTRAALLEPVLSSLGNQLEIWSSQFASSSPVRMTANGISVVDLIYDIPMNEIRKEIVQLLRSLVQSAEGRALLEQTLNEEQRQVFANLNLDYYYFDALAAQENDYDLLYTRTVTTLGVPVSSTLELPMDEEQTHFQSLLIEENGGLISCTLRSEDQLITLMIPAETDWNEISSTSVWIVIRPNPASENAALTERHALRLDLIHISDKNTDEESRDHEWENWEMKIQRDVSRLPDGEEAADYPEEIPVEFMLKLHYFSRYSQSSPTTLEIDASLTKKDFRMSLTGMVKTASPWSIEPFQIEKAVDIGSLSENDLNQKLEQLLTAAGEQFTPEVKETNPEDASPEELPGETEAYDEAGEDSDENAELQEENGADEPDSSEENDMEETEPDQLDEK